MSVTAIGLLWKCKFNTSPLALVSGRSEFPELMLYSYFGTLAAWQLCPFCLFGSVL